MLVLIGFYRVNSGTWTNRSFWYELDNALGAVLIIGYQLKYHAFISVALNFVWFGVAAIGLLTFFKRSRAQLFPKKRPKRRRTKR
jgi:hypothetical protein